LGIFSGYKKKKSVFEENPGSEIEIGRDIWRAA
jgi:hypothetical protein